MYLICHRDTTAKGTKQNTLSYVNYHVYSIPNIATLLSLVYAVYYLIQIFEDVRNRHFSNVLGYLSSKAKLLQQDFDVSN